MGGATNRNLIFFAFKLRISEVTTSFVMRIKSTGKIKILKTCYIYFWLITKDKKNKYKKGQA